MYGKSNVDRVERIKDIVDRLDARGDELMSRAFSEKSIALIDGYIRSLKILSDRAMRLQAIVDSMPRIKRTSKHLVGVMPSVN